MSKVCFVSPFFPLSNSFSERTNDFYIFNPTLHVNDIKTLLFSRRFYVRIVVAMV